MSAAYAVTGEGGAGGNGPGAWKAAQDKKGRTYYYNEATNQTSWTKPDGFVDEAGAGGAASPAPSDSGRGKKKKKEKKEKKKKKKKGGGVPEPEGDVPDDVMEQELPAVAGARPMTAGTAPVFDTSEAAALRAALEAEMMADDMSDDGGAAAPSGFDANAAAQREAEEKRLQKRKKKRAPDCVICLNKPAECKLYPCGHQCVCDSCVERERFESHDGDHQFYCPQCMALVEETVSGAVYERRMSQGGLRGSIINDANRRRSSVWNAAEAVPGLAGGNPFDTFDYEGLDEDFEDGPWVQPDFGKAEMNRRRVLYEGGTAPLCRAGSKQLAEMGIGVAMYFRFLKLMGLTLTLMSVFALPAIVICMEGDRVAIEDMDVLYMAKYTLGNLGSDASAEELGVFAVTPGDCGTNDFCNGTYIEILGEKYKAHQVSYLISAMDFINCIIFALFIVLFKWYQHRAVKRIERGAVHVEDYTVFVTGLPKDAEEIEIAQHFSSLFPLDAEDHKGRDPHVSLDGVEVDKEITFKPVEDVSHVQKRVYHGLWVADVAVVHPDGTAIRHFGSRMDLLHKLRTERARVKMYSEGTCLKSGADPKRRKRALKKAIMLGAEFDQMTQAVADSVGQMDDICIGAFVTFNHHQSRNRCLHDYGGARGLLQSAAMRFRGKHALRVEKAPPPSNLMWENIEESQFSLSMRRGLTTLGTILLLCVSLALVGAAQRKQQEFNDDVPNLEKCDEAVPALFFDGYDFIDRHAEAGLSTKLGLSRPEIAERSIQDAECQGSDTFFIMYDSELVDYNFTACAWDDLCPDPTALGGQICPCYSSTTDANCNTLPYFYPDDAEKRAGRSESTFAATTITGCYCWRALQNYIASSGVWSGAQEAYDLENDVCSDFLLNYLGAQSLAIGAICVVGVTNILMKYFLIYFASFERHPSFDAQARALMVKIWFGMLINTALTVVIVNVQPPDFVPQILKDTLLGGDIDDFNTQWYTRVGSSIAMTYVINIIAPHVEPLYKFLVFKPLQRRAAEKAIRKGHPVTVTQISLNLLDEGPRFDIAFRYASLLNTLFVTMIYSSGMPLLIPLCALSFVCSYWIDKLLLFRLYNRPPAFKDTLTTIARISLPFALVLHLCVSLWMFGNNELLASNVLNPEWLTGEAGAGDGADVQATYDQFVADSEDYDKIGLVPRIVRNNVFPHFVLLMLVTVALVLSYTVGPLITRCFRATAKSVAKAKAHLIADEGGLYPPFTETFEVKQDKFMGVAVSAKLHEVEVAQGWRVVKADTYRGKHYKEPVQLKRKVWLESETIDLVTHEIDAPKKTWEVIRDSALHSFRIHANPQYMMVMQLQKETQLLDEP